MTPAGRGGIAGSLSSCCRLEPTARKRTDCRGVAPCPNRFRWPSRDITQAEIDAVLGVMQSDRLSLGPRVVAFEQAVAERAGRGVWHRR